MKVPFNLIPADALEKLVEEYVTRDGTDYGEQEVSTEHKVEQITRQIKQNEVLIVFDEESESFNLVGARAHQDELS